MLAGLSFIEFAMLVVLFGVAFYYGRKQGKKSSTLVGYNQAQPILDYDKQCYAVAGKDVTELKKQCTTGTSLLNSETHVANPDFSSGFCCISDEKLQHLLKSERSMKTRKIDQIPTLPKPSNVLKGGLMDSFDNVTNGVLTDMSYHGPIYTTTWSLDPGALPEPVLGKWMKKNQMAQVYCDRMGGRFSMESKDMILCETEKYNPRSSYLGAKSV